MSSPVRLASFCRLCLSKTKDKVPVFADGNLLDNLLHLIEILIDPDDEPDAVVCYDCVVTLEGFHQFKEQCHVNDELIRTVPPKLDCSASSADLAEEEEDEDTPEEGCIEEEDHLELSEAEEVFQESPRRQSARKKTVKSKKKPGRPAKSSKKSPVRKPAKQKTPKALNKKKEEHKTSTENSRIEELQVLAESYPDYFYFEKNSRSRYYTIVYYGERYNSAFYTERYTYWRCSNRSRYQCSAQLVATNDYKTFERRYEHTHKQKPPRKEGQAFTPHEALPEVFKISKKIVLQHRAEKSMKQGGFEGKFQEFAASKKDDESEPVSPANKTKSSLEDSDEETEVVAGSRPKRKIKANARYFDGQAAPKKRSVEPETKPIKQARSEPDVDELDEGEPEDETIEEYLDLDKIEEECEALNDPKIAAWSRSLDEQLVLADSYPDYFFFEKGPRSVYFTLVYYGERYHSATFTANYTYWHCPHRRKYQCPAQVCVTNDYKEFERRYEHSHPDLPVKEGQPFTPMEALPELFKACRRLLLKSRRKQLYKYKLLQAASPPTAEQEEEDEIETVIEVQDGEEDASTDELSEEEIMPIDVEYDDLIEETMEP